MLSEQLPRHVAYLVLDIRDSNRINEYIKSFHGDKAIIEFYQEFTRVCSEIGLKKYGAWFSKQIGDRLDFAWDYCDLEKAISAAVEIYESCYGQFKEYYPQGVKLGIGVSTGEVIYDEKYNELKGDCPRVATIMQEKKNGIFITADRYNSMKEKYAIIPIPVSLRGEIHNIYQIVKKKHLKRLKVLNTKSFLRSINGLAQDMHYHVEGSTLGTPEMIRVIDDSIKEIASSETKSINYKKMTGRDVMDIRSGFVKRLVHNNAEENSFTFDEFLSKLFTSKACLCSSEENAGRFMSRAIKTLISVTPSFTIGLTPSIPHDFPYINRKKWNSEICNAFKNTIAENKHFSVKPTFVLETKRFHLLTDVYKQNLELIQELKKRVPQVQLALGLADDAVKTPLTMPEAQKGFEDYILSAREIDPEIQVQIHTLEQHGVPDHVGELNYLIDFFDKNNILGVTWIHLCFLNTLAGQVTKAQAEKFFEAFARRNDRIISCYSSNKCLGGPYILDDELALTYLLSERINWTIGADDPFAFGVSGIKEEMKITFNHLVKRHKDIELAERAFKIFSQNSWKEWDKELKRWVIKDEHTFSEKFGFDKNAFVNFFKKNSLEF